MVSRSTAQKESVRIINAEGIEGIHILTDEVFKVRIRATETREIKITSHSEGEYFNNIALGTRIENGQFYLSSNFPDRLTSGYDKLSAHKVFAVEISITIPTGLNVEILSNLASVEAEGEFDRFYADLNEGYCLLTDFSGDAVINTLEGDIKIFTNNVRVEAESRNGKVDIPALMRGEHLLRLRSLNGDIMLRKTK